MLGLIILLHLQWGINELMCRQLIAVRKEGFLSSILRKTITMYLILCIQYGAWSEIKCECFWAILQRAWWYFFSFEFINWGVNLKERVSSDRWRVPVWNIWKLRMASLLCSPFHVLKTQKINESGGSSWPWIFTPVNISIMIAIFSAVRSNVCTGRHASQPTLRMDSLFCHARWRALSLPTQGVMTYIKTVDARLREFTWRCTRCEFSMRQAAVVVHIPWLRPSTCETPILNQWSAVIFTLSSVNCGRS